MKGAEVIGTMILVKRLMTDQSTAVYGRLNGPLNVLPKALASP